MKIFFFILRVRLDRTPSSSVIVSWMPNSQQLGLIKFALNREEGKMINLQENILRVRTVEESKKNEKLYRNTKGNLYFVLLHSFSVHLGKPMPRTKNKIFSCAWKVFYNNFEEKKYSLIDEKVFLFYKIIKLFNSFIFNIRK